MKEAFKKWLCELLDYKWNIVTQSLFDNENIKLGILIKAMWQINRDNDFTFIMGDEYLIVMASRNGYEKHFHYNQHNNSELEALTKALIYIWENTK